MIRKLGSYSKHALTPIISCPNLETKTLDDTHEGYYTTAGKECLLRFQRDQDLKHNED